MKAELFQVYCKTRLNRVLLRADLPSLATVIDGGDEQEWKELKVSFRASSPTLMSLRQAVSDGDELRQRLVDIGMRFR